MDAAHELAVFGKMAQELPDYLLSGVLFWQLQAGSDFPKLSLGRLLLARARLRALEPRLSPAQQAAWREAEQQTHNALSQWQVAGERHASQELRARANLWQRFWEDCADSPCADNYAHEVGQRTMAELLLREFARVGDTPEARVLKALDTTVKARLRANGFVWDEALRPVFPEKDFWFLYGRPYGQALARR